MSTPNTALRAARMGMLMSQDDLARALRTAGCGSASKRLVQRWESGSTRRPRPSHARALERVIGLPIQTLGFDPVTLSAMAPDGRGGHDITPDDTASAVTTSDAKAQVHSPGDASAAAGYRSAGSLSGVWRSTYEYPSSGRGAVYTGRHHVVLLQHGDTLSIRSLPGSADSRLTLDLKLHGGVVTGTWSETTDPDGYYAGATYHGAIQLLAEPTGRRIAGKWVGFGSNFDVNTGPWEFVLLDSDTSRAGIGRWNHPPKPATEG